MIATAQSIPWVVLDSNVLVHKDWYLESTAGHVLRSEAAAGRWRIVIPEVVLIEAEARYRESVKSAEDKLTSGRQTLEKLRIPQGGGGRRPRALRYLEDLEQIITDAGGEILPIPDVPHRRLVEKAVARKRPFSPEGNGYRDALIWENVLELLDRPAGGVALISNDLRAFATSDKRPPTLAKDLERELVERGQGGSVTLYRELSEITSQVPSADELAARWRHTITDSPELRDALIHKLLEVAHHDADEVIGSEQMQAITRTSRFVSFSNPRELHIQEAWRSEHGSVLLDIELEVDYAQDFEAALPTAPRLDQAPWEWSALRGSGSMVLTFEAVQHDPDSDPSSVAARLTGWREPDRPTRIKRIGAR